jgi:hypothetical protein
MAAWPMGKQSTNGVHVGTVCSWKSEIAAFISFCVAIVGLHIPTLASEIAAYLARNSRRCLLMGIKNFGPCDEEQCVFPWRSDFRFERKKETSLQSIKYSIIS